MFDRLFTLKTRVERGEEAEALLSNALLKHAMDAMEAEVVTKLKQLPPTDLEGRDAWWRELRAIASFKGRLVRYVSDGREAKPELLKEYKKQG